MIRLTFFFLCFSLPLQADEQTARAAEIESLSNTFGFEDILDGRFPKTAILIDGCRISFIEFFPGSGVNAHVLFDDLSLIPLHTNNNGDFTDSQRANADWVSLYFTTSANAVKAHYRSVPSQTSPRDILAREPYDEGRGAGARYLNYWYPETDRVETIARKLIAYQSAFCRRTS